VDDLGRVGIGRDAADRAAGRPDDAVDDVGGVAAALAEHADRHDLRAVRHARHAGVVVGDRRDGAGDMAAMPAGVAGRVAAAALVGGIPVTLVLCVAITAVAVARHARVADEVVAGQHVGVEVAVVGDAGIDHRHHDAAAVGRIPGLVGLDAARGFPVVPLVAGVVGVVGGGCRL